MTDYQAQIGSAVQATRVTSPSGFRWFGELHRLPRSRLSRLEPSLLRTQLVASLRARLYTDFYCNGSARAAPAHAAPDSPVPVRSLSFVERLSAANSGGGPRDPGWSVDRVEGSAAIVTRDRLQLRVEVQECAGLDGAPLRPGTVASLRLPKESWAISPGFYLARGDVGFAADPPQGLIRLYWNISAAGAPRLMEAMTMPLNRYRVPFVLKVWTSLPAAPRCDAVVLYLQSRDLPAVADTVSSVYRSVQEDLHPRTPAFTKVLGKGLGLAEDPGAGASFGLHRCGLLAEGLVRAYERNLTSLDARLELIRRHFAEQGVDLEAPYLNAGSTDGYVLALGVCAIETSRLSLGVTEAPLHTSFAIGSSLCRAALWHEDRCNWLGARLEPVGPFARSAETYGTLGPELYSGTSGAALFLAHLYDATGDAATRRTALGAIRHAISHVDEVPGPARLGLYTGWTGIAFAAARLATLLAEEGLLETARALVRRCDRELQPPSEFDLLSGAAGAIVALVALQDSIEDELSAELAVRLGYELVRTAEKSEIGWSWMRASAPRQRSLTGLSHGAAGAGYALLELFDATGIAEFRAAAERAFDYERHWFDPAVGNWPDFRDTPASRKASRGLFSFATAWCHGASGIARSRMRGYEILGDPVLRSEAVCGLRATRRAVAQALELPGSDFSLCHGLTGNADALLHGAQLIGAQAADALALARRVGDLGAQRYAPGGIWPCGVGAGVTPSLMLGLAGIGSFYLRLYDPDTPSPLLPRGRALEPSAGAAPG